MTVVGYFAPCTVHVIRQTDGTERNDDEWPVIGVVYLMTDPPEKPTISGYIDGRSVYAGNVLSLTCTSVGGNPAATLTWLKGLHSLSPY